MVVPHTEKAKKAFAARLKRAFLEVGELGPERGLSQRIADRYRPAFTYQAVQKWLKGQSLPDTLHLTMICTDLRISVDWLFSGEGHMRIADRERGSWPFRFPQERFDALTPGQKVAINGILEGAVVDYESLRPTSPAQGRR